MKMKWMFLCFLILTPLGLQAKEKIAVFPFTTEQSGDAGVTRQAENLCIELLVNQNRFDVMERSQLDRLIQEQKLQLSGMVSTEDAVSIGKVGGVKYGVLGEITNASYETVRNRDSKTGQVTYTIEATLMLQMRIIDIESGQVILSDTFKRPGGGLFRVRPTGTRSEVFSKWIGDIFKDDVRKAMTVAFPLEGTIVSFEADGKSVMLDIGSNVGVTQGMRFCVVLVEKKVVAATQKVLNIESTVAVLEAKEVKAEVTIAKIKSGKEAVKEGLKIITCADQK